MKCIFCDKNFQILSESKFVYAILDEFPVSDGHALIIPKRHCDDYFKLTLEEQSYCWMMVNEIKQILVDKFNPDGFNIGINVGETAGQSVPHVHIHLIPRYDGDVKNPRGGVRGIIPGKQNY